MTAGQPRSLRAVRTSRQTVTARCARCGARCSPATGTLGFGIVPPALVWGSGGLDRSPAGALGPRDWPAGFKQGLSWVSARPMPAQAGLGGAGERDCTST